MSNEDDRERLLRLFKENRFLAHRELFPHRHKDRSADFHPEIVELFNDPALFVAMTAFRGSAKSTLLEEDVLLKALFKEEDYILFIGPKWESACEHVMAIRNELEMNDMLIELFGDQKASPWSNDEVQLANGVKIKALGAGQAMRGTKNNSERPSYAAIDDLEDEENIKTEESRRRTERWMVGTLIPALHPTKGRVRFIGTPLHPKALIVKKCQDAEWRSRTFPILYLAEGGEETASWPARFPMEWIRKRRQDYLNAGNFIEFEQEYMCRAEDIAGKPFQANMLKVEPAPAAFLPVEIAIDPARTVKEHSARTAYVAGSWFGNKLIVHDAIGAFHKPDEMINTVFAWNRKFQPALIHVEANSLDEYIMQPLRTESLRRGIPLPIEPVYAPKNKDDFIRGMQPLYMAGNIIHAKHLPDLEQELLQFPTGRKDVPNALAYFLRTRAGRTVYEDFTAEHIASILEPSLAVPRWLVFSARAAMTTAVLMQYVDGVIRVYQDWILDRPPMEAFSAILREAIMASEGPVKVAAPVEQFDKYLNFGLNAAATKDNIKLVQAGRANQAEGALKEWLIRRGPHGQTFFLAQQNTARRVINGIARGYYRKLDKRGILEPFPAENQYRVLLEGIESFVMWFDSQYKMDNQDGVRYAFTQDGRRYISLLPGGMR